MSDFPNIKVKKTPSYVMIGGASDYMAAFRRMINPKESEVFEYGIASGNIPDPYFGLGEEDGLYATRRKRYCCD